MHEKTIYVAGPYSSDPKGNTEKACLIAHELREMGHFPFVPHLWLMWDELYPRPYEDWMSIDFHWIKKCDALIRFPGHSPGADREIIYARKLGLEIYHYPEDLEKIGKVGQTAA